MANYDDGHVAKRMRTDTNGGHHNNFYNQRRGGDDESKVNHILLMTVMNPSYPITVDVIHTIASPLGKVLRIVIFKKNGVQAMVEFDSVDSARKAKQSLSGADIYSGCCTLKIEFAKPEKLNVYKNDSESWDYTNPNMGAPQKDGQRSGPLLQSPPSRFPRNEPSNPPSLSSRGRGGPMRGRGGFNSPRGGGVPPRGQAPPSRYDSYGGGHDYPPSTFQEDRYGGSRDNYEYEDGGYDRPRGPYPGHHSGMHDDGYEDESGAVLMVYGMNPEQMNCDRLFNLLCLYGNVMKIKFLKTKEGCAMVQMSDYAAVERAVYNLNQVLFFGKKVQLSYSKQTVLTNVMSPFDLPDGTKSFKSYMNSRNNRFMTPEAANKNRIANPVKKLHFFNTPFGINEEELTEVFVESGSKAPANIKMFTSKTERSSSGIIEFESIADACEAVVLCNHKSVSHPNAKQPYMMKLCFSASNQRM